MHPITLHHQMDQIMSQIDELKAAIEAQSTVVASVVTLVGKLHDEVKAAQAGSSDPASFQPLLDKLNLNTAAIANAVIANTDAAETPVPVPSPVDAPVAPEAASSASDVPPANDPGPAV